MPAAAGERDHAEVMAVLEALRPQGVQACNLAHPDPRPGASGVVPPTKDAADEP